jgi:arylsulfatase A-like enzyme
MISRRHFLATAASIGAAAVTGVRAEEAALHVDSNSPGGSPAAGAPNILIFMPDQQNGATVLPGSPVLKPTMNKFMAEAITFTAAHCPAPHCCPSRASFMSSMYPSEHGVYNNVTTDTAIHPNPYPGTPYWGLELRNTGYQMGYAGKLHVGRDVTPETCGFENLSHLEQDSLKSNEARKSELWRQSREEIYDPAKRQDGEMVRPGWTNSQLYKTLPDGGPRGYENLADYKIVQAGIAGMQRMAAAGKPWCLMISNSGGHDPYNAPKKFVDMYDPEKIELPVSFNDTLDDKPRIYQRQRYQYWSQLSAEENKQALLHYYAKCTMQDAIFGEILDALEKTGQVDNTIVLYISDHGDYRAAHGLWMKGVPAFREAYHIPAVIRWPRGIKQPGRQVDAFVDQVDFGPTFLEACSTTSSKILSGASLMPWLKAERPLTWRRAACSQMNGVELYYTQRIAMTKDYKYVYNGFDYDELYDLKNDPHELHNLAFPDLSAKRTEVLAGGGLAPHANVPWPQLSAPLEEARRDLIAEMWNFAAEHHDTIFNPYGTVAMAPYGPGLGKDPDN